MQTRSKMDTKSLTSMAMLVTLAYVVVLISKQIPIRVAGFLDMDFSDVVVIIGGFMFGPLSAAAISGVVAFIELMTISDTGVYGYIMNVVSTCSFVCVSAAFYKKNRNMRSAVIGLIAGCISVTAVMMLWNYIVTPIYLEIPRQAVAPMLVPVFLPYNLLKSGINAALAVLLYKPLVVGLRRAKLVPESSDSSQGKINLGAMLAAAFILVSLILLFLVLAGVL